MVIGIDGSEFRGAVTAALGDIPGLTVVTNSLAAAREVDARDIVSLDVQQLVLTGGSRVGSDVLRGPVAVRTLERLHMDIAFINIIGVEIAIGFSAATLEQAETSSMLAQQSTMTAVMVPDHALGVRGICGIESLDHVDKLVRAYTPTFAYRGALGFLSTSIQVAADQFG